VKNKCWGQRDLETKEATFEGYLESKGEKRPSRREKETNTVLTIQGSFCYCRAVLIQSQGFFCFSTTPPASRLGVHEKLVAGTAGTADPS